MKKHQPGRILSAETLFQNHSEVSHTSGNTWCVPSIRATTSDDETEFIDWEDEIDQLTNKIDALSLYEPDEQLGADRYFKRHCTEDDYKVFVFVGAVKDGDDLWPASISDKEAAKN